jgi:type IV pilus secretin PilQ/predicted competence protein
MRRMPHTKLARPAVQLWLVAAVASAWSLGLAAGTTPVRLLGVSSQGSAVLIEASEPVAYSVNRPDPLTVLVEMRNVTARQAANVVERRDPIAGVTVEEGVAIDGRSVARVRVALARASEHRVRSARGTIRLELIPIVEREAPAAGLPLPVVPPAAASAAPATSLESVRTSMSGGRTIVTFQGNGRLTPTEVREAADAPRRLVLDFAAVTPRAAAQTAIDSPLVSGVRVALHSRNPLLTRVELDLSQGTTYFVERGGDEGHDLSVVLEPPAGSPVVRLSELPPGDSLPEAVGPAPIDALVQAKDAAPMVEPVAAPVAAPPADVPAPRGFPVPPTRFAGAAPVSAQQAPTTQPGPPPQSSRQYTGEPISLDLTGVDLRALLRVFAQHSGLNIIIDPSVPTRPVDILLRDLPWDQAMEIVLRSYQLGYEAEGTVIRIAPLKVLEDEQRQRQSLANAKALAGDLQVQTFSLSYATANDLSGLISKSVLSTRGQIQIDTRTNTLIIMDLPDNLQTAAALLATLDRPEPQVEVEARVVQTTRDFARAIGVQWGLNGRMTPELGNTTNLAFPNQGTLGAIVNHPEQAASSAIQLAMGSVNGAFNLDVALSALERTGKGRVLSTPRLTTQNNVEAEVAQGIQIPIQTVANNTVTVTFKDAVLTLKVTPQITSANTVIMKVTLENATPDFSREVNGIPPIDTQRANTQVQVDDGATTVIGGIFVSREQVSTNRTPMLHRIPLLGWMFRRDSTQDESRELLIFITPRILKGL